MIATASPAPERPDRVDPHEYVGEEMTLVEHLEELRARLFKSALAVAVGFIVGFVFRDRVLALIQEPYCSLSPQLRNGADVLSGGADCTLVALRVLDPFLVSVKAAAIVAVVLSAPVVCYQIWRFVTPGLRPVERRYAIPFIVLSQVLFAGGAAFSYLLIPRALEFLLGFAGPTLTPVLSANEYLTFILQTMIAFGVSFEFPLVLVILSLMGVVTSAGLRRWRRYALFGVFAAAAIITPTQDPVTMTLMALPLAAFYEGSVVAARLIERSRERVPAES